jgi:hypothetical protein
MGDMEITQGQADKFCGSLKSFHDSLEDDEKQVLEQILEQADAAVGSQAEAKPQRPFFEKFLTLNPVRTGGTDSGKFVTLKFPSDSDEGDTDEGDTY